MFGTKFSEFVFFWNTLISSIFRKYDLLRRIRELILVTDLAKQPAFIKKANEKLSNSEASLTQEETMKLMLKCADISNEVRPANISQPIIHSLYEEMFEQGKGCIVLPHINEICLLIGFNRNGF